MTFVGKILVILIMLFAILFLGLSTVVFSTATNWKTRVTELNAAKTKLEDQLTRARGEADTQVKNVQEATNKIADNKRDFDKQLKALNDDRTRYSDEVTKQRTTVETALTESRSSQQEAEARTAETKQLRDILKTVQEQANEFKLQKTDLQQEIVIMKRELEVAKTNNSDLRNRVSVFQSALRKLGASADISTYKAIAQPPDVEGVVTKVDPTKTVIEISIGSNDGLVPGHELDIYHLLPQPEYIGKVRILETDPQQASARLIGKTVFGKKIQEGDNVTTKIRPRS